MLKITKGLKKKKKGKKSKHKDEDLFDSAELEEYRKQQQLKQQEGGGEGQEEGRGEEGEKSEEWQKFKALTSGVDDILKKTQGDLDRIKSTSFFQRKPPGPSQPAKEVRPARPEPPVKGKWVGFEESVDHREDPQEQASRVEEPEKVEVHVEEEEESEFEDDQDDIFDTSYVDVVASGEVKLAYVPDSPIEEEDGPDPFDTSIVEKVIKVDPKEQKRNLVNLGCAVEVLTGKLDKSPCRETAQTTSRHRPKTQDLLLGSFEDGEGSLQVEGEPEPAPKSILDDDPVFEEETSAVLGLPSVAPLVDNKPHVAPEKPEQPEEKNIILKSLVEEFVPSLGREENDKSEKDDLEDEFAALAAESVSKKAPPPRPKPHHFQPEENTEDLAFDEGDDPFDTSFASQILPGKLELKIIEKEILEKEIIVSVSTVEEKIHDVLKTSELSVRVSKSDNVLFENEVEPLSLKHRDLLGGSTTDLTKIDQAPIAPKSVRSLPEELQDSDPFDTDIAKVFTVPGKNELKYLEKELLDQPKPAVPVELDNDFDPRAEETPVKVPSRPDNLSVGKRSSIPKVVAFDVKLSNNNPDLLSTVGQDENSKVGKPLTPYYAPAQAIEDAKSFEDDVDPFDTSFVSNAPGKLELQILEKELVQDNKTIKHSLSDPDFDPRNSEEVIKPIVSAPKQEDILSGEVVVNVKLHTPVAPKKFVPNQPEDFDPFDTSIASGLAPGKAEIKILETELIHNQELPPVPVSSSSIIEKLRRDSVSSVRHPSATDVLEQPPDDITVKPLTPLPVSSSFEDDIDPFDTSCAGDNLPGKTEIKILESELMLS